MNHKLKLLLFPVGRPKDYHNLSWLKEAHYHSNSQWGKKKDIGSENHYYLIKQHIYSQLLFQLAFTSELQNSVYKKNMNALSQNFIGVGADLYCWTRNFQLMFSSKVFTKKGPSVPSDMILAHAEDQ